jgi:hypothetical protein
LSVAALIPLIVLVALIPLVVALAGGLAAAGLRLTIAARRRLLSAVSLTPLIAMVSLVALIPLVAALAGGLVAAARRLIAATACGLAASGLRLTIAARRRLLPTAAARRLIAATACGLAAAGLRLTIVARRRLLSTAAARRLIAATACGLAAAGLRLTVAARRRLLPTAAARRLIAATACGLAAAGLRLTIAARRRLLSTTAARRLIAATACGLAAAGLRLTVAARRRVLSAAARRRLIAAAGWRLIIGWRRGVRRLIGWGRRLWRLSIGRRVLIQAGGATATAATAATAALSSDQRRAYRCMRRHLARGLSGARTAVVRERIQASNRRASSGTGIVAGIGRTLVTADSPAFALAAIRCAALVSAIVDPAAPRKIGQVFGLRWSAVVGPANDVGRAIWAKIPADGLLFTRSIGLADRPFDRFTQPAALAAVRRAAVAGAIVYPAG